MDAPDSAVRRNTTLGYPTRCGMPGAPPPTRDWYTRVAKMMASVSDVSRLVALLLAAVLPATCNGAPAGPGTELPPSVLGPGASLDGLRPFPADNPWNTDVSAASVDGVCHTDRELRESRSPSGLRNRLEWGRDRDSVHRGGRVVVARPCRITSADRAGLPIFPGLVRYDEAVDPSSFAGEYHHQPFCRRQDTR